MAGDTFEGTGTDAGNYLSYQTFGQIASTGTGAGTIPTITHTDVYAGASVSATNVPLSGTEEVALFGLTFQADSQSTGYSTRTMVINAIPEPSAFAAVLGYAVLAAVARRRR